MFTLGLLSLIGCDAFNKVKTTIDGLLDPVVAQGLVLGVEPPDSSLLDGVISGGQFDAGTTATLFIADAKEVRDIENAPIAGAEVTLRASGADVVLGEIDVGTYSLDPTDAEGVVYTGGETWTLTVKRANPDGTPAVSQATLELPASADFSDQIPEQHTENTPITLDFTGLGFSSALVVVLDENGDVTFSNEPGTIKEFYDFTHSNNALTTVEIPGSAFGADAVHAVGVAGLVNTDAQDLEEMNTALSTVVYGKMNFYPASTRVLPIP